MIVLRNNVGQPPGGLPYTDPRVPSATWTDMHTNIDDRARQVMKFRLANPAVYPEREWTHFPFVRQQIVDFNAQRLNNDANFFLPSDVVTPPPPPPESQRLCTDCGIGLKPKYCVTCGGNKIQAYECPTCKKEYPK